MSYRFINFKLGSISDRNDVIYKLVVVDVDGTILDSPRQKRASERLARATANLQAQGTKVCLATARSLMCAQPVIESLHLKDPLILSGGARIVDGQTGKELWALPLNPIQVMEVTEIARRYSQPCLWNEYSIEEYLQGGTQAGHLNDEQTVYFLEMCFLTPGEARKIKKELQSIDGLAVTTTLSQKKNLRDIHVTNRGATKEHAVYKLQSILDVNREETIGVGDGYNDLDLFRAVGLKIAMKNAVDELKSASDKCIDHVRNDGLARFFEELARERPSHTY